MRRDPIVEEVRAAGEKLAEAVDDDLDRFFDMIRKNQQNNRDRLVTRPARRLEATALQKAALAAAVK